MNAPGHANPQPVVSPVTPPAHPVLDEHSPQPAPSRIGTPLRTLALCLGSFAVMVPSPLLGIVLTQPYFDKGSEAFLLFGGITMFPLMILALFGSVPEVVLIVLIVFVWLAGAVVPDVWLRRRLRSWRDIGGLLATQTAFSLAQAVMGALLIVGKSV